MKKLSKIFVALVVLFAASFASASQLVGDVNMGGFVNTQYIKVYAFDDPQIPGITCHISTISYRFSWSDPSHMSIACRQTGHITLPEGFQKQVTIDGISKGPFKALYVDRMYDATHKTLIYVAYSLKTFNGSHKNAISTVALYDVIK